MSAFYGVYLIEGSRNLKEEHNSPDTDLHLPLTRPTVTHKHFPSPHTHSRQHTFTNVWNIASSVFSGQ